MTSSETDFKQNYQTHLKHLKLKGLQPKTIEAYSRAMRRIGVYFDEQVNDLSESQLTDYFSDLLESHSWSSVKLDLYGLKFFYTYVLKKPWPELKLIKPPRTQRLPDIVTAPEVGRLFAMTHTLRSGNAFLPDITADGMFLFNIFNTDTLECRAGKASARPRHCCIYFVIS